MGDDYGPLVISREPMDLDALQRATIAVPGMMTTAYLTLRLCMGDVKTVVVPFDQIMDSVERGDVDAGLLIHEGQLTYAREGLCKEVGEQGTPGRAAAVLVLLAPATDVAGSAGPEG